MSLTRIAVLALLAPALMFTSPASAVRRRAEAPPAQIKSIAKPPADVPLDHWSYPLLERLDARGVIDLDLSTRPVSRADVSAAVEAAAARADLSLTEREAWVMSRLEAEFVRGEVDSPVFSTEAGTASFGLGVTVFTQLRHGGEALELNLWPGSAPGGITPGRDVGIDDDDDAQLDVASDIDYEIWGGIEGLVGFYADSQILLGGQEGARQVRLSSRVRTWRGSTYSTERAYFKLARPNFSVVVGRRGTAWGRSRWGGLLLSGTAPSFDQFDAKFRVGALSIEAMHAFLEYEELGTEVDMGEGDNAFLAAHRLVVRGGWGSVGIGEAVVYNSATPEPVYVNPLMLYYLSQHNERENDNVLWLLDGVFNLRPGLTAYAEFLIDDLQYERSTVSPDKYGATVGGAWYGVVRGLDAELTAEYTNVRNWTYTHIQTEHRFAQDGAPIGFELGTDADRFRSEFVIHPAIKWSVSATYEYARKGEGRLADPFVEGDNEAPTFPSGVVESGSRFAAELGYQGLEGLSAGLGAAFESVSNVGNTLGQDDDGWEFWVGVEFRL